MVSWTTRVGQRYTFATEDAWKSFMEELYADARRAANSRNDCLELPWVRAFTKATVHAIQN